MGTNFAFFKGTLWASDTLAPNGPVAEALYEVSEDTVFVRRGVP